MKKRYAPEVYKRYKVTATYFRGNRKYGRTTTIVDKKTGKKDVFMGALSKGEAISQYWFRHGQPTVFKREER